MSIDWDKRQSALGKHKHLQSDIVDETTGEVAIDPIGSDEGDVLQIVDGHQAFAAASGLPSEWTTDEFGNVIIAPTEAPGGGLGNGNVHIIAAVDAQDALTITDSDNPDEFNFGIDPFGYLLGGAGSGADFETANSPDSYTVLKVAGASASGQVHDLLQIKNNTLNRLIRVLRTGYLVMSGQNAAPADADVPTSGIAFWFDDSNGSGKLMVKGKTADGTVVSGSVNLT